RYDIHVKSPDGWVEIDSFVDKGTWDEYVLTTSTGKKIRCNENHLFQKSDGEWIRARDGLFRFFDVITEDGIERAFIKTTGDKIPIVDISINHSNHRYFTEGVSSHNTGVGKSLTMCSFAADNLLRGKN